MNDMSQRDEKAVNRTGARTKNLLIFMTVFVLVGVSGFLAYNHYWKDIELSQKEKDLKRSQQTLKDKEYRLKVSQFFGQRKSIFSQYLVYQEPDVYIAKMLQAIKDAEPAIGPDHVEMGSAYFHLAMMYYDGQHHKLAEINYQRSLKIFEKHYGPEHHDIAMVHANLGHVYFSLGRYVDSKESYLKALDYFERHPQVNAQDLKRLNNMLLRVEEQLAKTPRWKLLRASQGQSEILYDKMDIVNHYIQVNCSAQSENAESQNKCGAGGYYSQMAADALFQADLKKRSAELIRKTMSSAEIELWTSFFSHVDYHAFMSGDVAENNVLSKLEEEGHNLDYLSSKNMRKVSRKLYAFTYLEDQGFHNRAAGAAEKGN